MRVEKVECCLSLKLKHLHEARGGNGLSVWIDRLEAAQLLFRQAGNVAAQRIDAVALKFLKTGTQEFTRARVRRERIGGGGRGDAGNFAARRSTKLRLGSFRTSSRKSHGVERREVSPYACVQNT
jgi:hypothetical protein